MITGEHAVLRPPDDDDAPVLGALRNDLDLQAQLMARPRPSSPRRVQEWIDRIAGDPASVFFTIAARADGRAVGFVQLTAMDLVSGHGQLGIAVAAEHRRKGYADEAIALLGWYARQVFSLRKLLLEVRADNEGAIALYRRAGFREVGTFHEHHRVGDRYVDVVLMEQPLAR